MGTEIQELRKKIVNTQGYKAHTGYAIFESVATIGLIMVCWVVMYITQDTPWVYACILPCGVFVVKAFTIQHDCGHNSFFAGKYRNIWLGRLISLITWTPFYYWKSSHHYHHTTSGNLDTRHIGGFKTLTSDQYMNLPITKRYLYRMYRSPIVVVLIDPLAIFVLQHRTWIGSWGPKDKNIISVLTTSAGIISTVTFGMYMFGVVQFLVLMVGIIWLAGIIGVWFFFVQHQFESTHYAHSTEWKARKEEIAFLGSSFYDLPLVVQWLTGNIGIHHVHHLVDSVPSYRLNRVLKDMPELASLSNRITFLQSISFIKLALWDKKNQRLISFKEARS